MVRKNFAVFQSWLASAGLFFGLLSVSEGATLISGSPSWAQVPSIEQIEESGLEVVDAGDDLNDPNLPTPPYLKRFRQLAPGFYRGSQPTSVDLGFLKEQGIKTIISLVRAPRDLIEWEQEEASVQGLKFHSFPIHSFSGPSAEQVTAVFSELLRPSNQPVFVHCKHGKDRTGLIAGLYRVHIQGWTPDSAYQEAKSLGFNPWLLGLRQKFKKFMIQAPWELNSEPEMLEWEPAGPPHLTP